MSVPTRDTGATSHILPAERAKASFDSAVLQGIVSGTRPSRINQFTDLFSGPEFDASMDDFESYVASVALGGAKWCLTLH